MKASTFYHLTLGLMCVVGVASMQAQERSYSRHPVSGVVASHPPSWEASVTTSYLALISPATDASDVYRENVTITLQPVERGITLEAFGDASRNALQQPEQRVNDITATDTTWSGKKAIALVYSAERDLAGQSRPLRCKQLMRLLYEDVVIIATFMSEASQYENLIEEVGRIFDSIVIQNRTE